MSRLNLDETAIQFRIQQYERAFFDSISTGEDALKEFSDRWAELADMVPPTSYSLLHRVSKTIGVLCESLISLEESAQEIQNDLEAELDMILDRANPVDPSGGVATVAPTRRDVSLAAEWMAQNFSNPYPSSAIRDDISRRANWSRKDVDNWFTEARKRIGWNAIRKQFFANRQAEAVKAATDFFSGQSHSLEPALESALSAMAERVQELYIEPFQPSKLAMILGKEGKSESAAQTQSTESYTIIPRATLSRPISPVSQPLSPISRSVSPVRSTRKRRMSVVDSGDETEIEGRKKRARHQEPIAPTFPQTQLPSPAASQADLTERSPAASELSDPDGKPRRSPLLTPLSNPKRQRSHSVMQRCPKNLSAGRRAAGIQVVSAPLPTHSQSSYPHHSILPSSEVPDPDTSASSSLSISPAPLPASESTLPSVQSDLVQDLLFQAQIPQFSFEFPGPVTCSQPAPLQPVDLTLFNSANSQPCVPTFNGNTFSATSALLGTAPQLPPPAENVDITSLPSLFGDSLSNDQLLGLLPLAFDHTTTSVPPVQTNALSDLTEVDVSFSPFLNFDTGTSQLPGPQIDDIFFADFFHNTSPFPSAIDTEKAKRMAHLEMLKKQQNHLQERIQSLENELSGRLSA